MMKKLSLIVLPVMALYGCNSSSSNLGSVDSCKALNSETFSCEQMLNDIVEHAVQPTVISFKTSTQTLVQNTTAYCSALETETDEANALAEAQSAWQQSMAIWQQLEVMQFGPLASERDEFYSWPLNDSCKVDEEVVFSLEEGYDIAGATPARRGLDALEYVFFHEYTSTSCADSNTTAALAEWDQKPVAEKIADRCSFAEKVATDLQSRAQALETTYDQYDITDAPSLHAVANKISDGLFYIDKKTKDDKANKALPDSTEGAFNTAHLESQYAEASLSNIQNNLIGAKKVFTADGQSGLNAYLTAVGQDDLVDDMINSLNAAIDASSDTHITASMMSIIAAAQPDDVAVCINAVAESTSLLEKVCALPAPIIKAFTDDLKNRFVMTLNLAAPADAEGEND